ncbi:hypothetical protein X975_16319, partial [Stegodyphus mimosarum]
MKWANARLYSCSFKHIKARFLHRCKSNCRPRDQFSESHSIIKNRCNVSVISARITIQLFKAYSPAPFRQHIHLTYILMPKQ